MLAVHRRFLLINQTLGAAIFNLVLNYFIAWGMFRGHETVPFWGRSSIAADTMSTCLILPFLTCIADGYLSRRTVLKGNLPPLNWTVDSHPFLSWLPRNLMRRGAVLSVVSLVCFAFPTILALAGLGAAAMRLEPFMVFKALFAAVLAAVVTPVISLYAIDDAGQMMAAKCASGIGEASDSVFSLSTRV